MEPEELREGGRNCQDRLRVASPLSGVGLLSGNKSQSTHTRRYCAPAPASRTPPCTPCSARNTPTTPQCPLTVQRPARKVSLGLPCVQTQLLLRHQPSLHRPCRSTACVRLPLSHLSSSSPPTETSAAMGRMHSNGLVLQRRSLPSPRTLLLAPSCLYSPCPVCVTSSPS